MPHRGPNFRDTQVNTSQQAKPKMRRNYVQTATEHAIRSTKHRYVPHVHRCTCQVLRALKENVGGIRTGGKTKSSHYFSGCSAGPGTVHTGLEAQNKSLGAAMQAWDTAGRRSHPLAHIPSDHRRQVASAAPTAPSLAQATEGHASQPPGEGGSDARRVPPRALAGHEECTVSTSPAGTEQCMVRSSHTGTSQSVAEHLASLHAARSPEHGPRSCTAKDLDLPISGETCCRLLQQV